MGVRRKAERFGERLERKLIGTGKGIAFLVLAVLLGALWCGVEIKSSICVGLSLRRLAFALFSGWAAGESVALLRRANPWD